MPEQHILDRLTTLEAKIDKLNSTVSSMQDGLLVLLGGVVSCANSNFSGAGEYGISAIGGGIVFAYQANASIGNDPNEVGHNGIVLY